MKVTILFTGITLLATGQNALAQTTESNWESNAERHVPATLDADGKAIVGGLNRFSADMYHVLVGEKGDVVISPASISTAIGLAYAGANGRTAAEIAAALHYPSTVANFHASFGALLATMHLDSNGRTLAVNNAIWLQQGLPVRETYRSLVEKYYGAGLQRVDFEGDSGSALLAINGWVEENTHNRIRNFLSSAEVNGATRSVLVNTVYFKADWAHPFNESETKTEPFKLASGSTRNLPLMHQRSDFAYAERSGIKALRIPYRGAETEMIVLLPDTPHGLAKLEKSINAKSLQGWLDLLDNSIAGDVITTLPKFRIEKRYNLKPALQALGMITPFSDLSDFSAMKPVDLTSGNPLGWNLKIESVIHQVFVEVEEKGTEAAAASAGVITLTGLNPRKPPPPKTFRADRPFLFVIRDRRTRAILFIGRYTGEPES